LEQGVVAAGILVVGRLRVWSAGGGGGISGGVTGSLEWLAIIILSVPKRCVASLIGECIQVLGEIPQVFPDPFEVHGNPRSRIRLLALLRGIHQQRGVLGCRVIGGRIGPRGCWLHRAFWLGSVVLVFLVLWAFFKISGGFKDWVLFLGLEGAPPVIRVAGFFLVGVRMHRFRGPRGSGLALP
jgi:hypothetical protein